MVIEPGNLSLEPSNGILINSTGRATGVFLVPPPNVRNIRPIHNRTPRGSGQLISSERRQTKSHHSIGHIGRFIVRGRRWPRVQSRASSIGERCFLYTNFIPTFFIVAQCDRFVRVARARVSFHRFWHDYSDTRMINLPSYPRAHATF